MARRSVGRVIVSTVFGIIIFLLIVFLVNLMGLFITNSLFRQAVLFLNSNVWLLILISITFAAGELFNALNFPLNLPAPLFNASASVLLISFLFIIFQLVDSVLGLKISGIFSGFSFIIYPAVFVIVLIVGYAIIFSEAVAEKPHKKKRSKED